jgi:hypothetical protein
MVRPGRRGESSKVQSKNLIDLHKKTIILRNLKEQQPLAKQTHLGSTRFHTNSVLGRPDTTQWTKSPLNLGINGMNVQKIMNS